MFSLKLVVTGAPKSLDVPAVEAAMTEAAREAMRRKGLPRGANLSGVTAAAARAAERELQAQIDRAAGEGE